MANRDNRDCMMGAIKRGLSTGVETAAFPRETPSSKFQAPEKLQITSRKPSASVWMKRQHRHGLLRVQCASNASSGFEVEVFWSLRFGVSDLSGAWGLGFGALQHCFSCR